MSLINDALKRAERSAKHPAGNGEPPLQPVHDRGGSPLPVILGLLLGLSLVSAGWFFWQWSQSRKPAGNAVPPAVRTAAPEPAVPEPVPAPPPHESPPVAETPRMPAAPDVQAAVSAAPPPPAPIPDVPVPAAAPVPPPPAAPVFPELKLQGIFYSATRPAAMLNGRTIRPGGKVNGVTVVKIEPEAVTVEWNGEQRVLEPQP